MSEPGRWSRGARALAFAAFVAVLILAFVLYMEFANLGLM